MAHWPALVPREADPGPSCKKHVPLKFIWHWRVIKRNSLSHLDEMMLSNFTTDIFSLEV